MGILHLTYPALYVGGESPAAARAQPKPSYVEALDFALHWRVKPERLYMAMIGYFDESGTHGRESPLMAVAGFLASVEQWGDYQRDLGSLLAEYEVKTFHAKDFRGRKNDFKGWPTPKRARFNSRFLRLADEHLACGLATILPSADYQQIYRSAAFPRTARPDTQYGMCVRAALWKSILFMKDRGDDWPLSVILEGGTGHEADAARVFYEVKDGLRPEYEPLLGGVTFGSKADLPIAVADSLAYAIFRMSAGYSQHPTEPNAAVVGPADPPYYVHKIPMSRTLIDENTLASLRDGLCVR
jgi:hypothetical protein